MTGINLDQVIAAGFTEERATEMVRSFQEYIEANRDEITALQVLYQRPYQQRLTHADIRALADANAVAAPFLDHRRAVGGLPQAGKGPGARAPASG